MPANVTFGEQQQEKTETFKTGQWRRLAALKWSFENIMSLWTKLRENLSKSLIFKRAALKNTLQMVQAYSNSLGCSNEYIFFPLLTLTASFIGTNGTVKINDCWEEPSIAWFKVCAQKGSEKDDWTQCGRQTYNRDRARTPTAIQSVKRQCSRPWITEANGEPLLLWKATPSVVE